VALHIRYQYDPGSSLGISIERLSDGLFYDFSTSGTTAASFTTSPGTQVTSLTAESGNFSGRYSLTLAQTPVSVFPDGQYCVNIHDMNRANQVVAILVATMSDGDDALLKMSGGPDPWSVVLPGNYASGTAGALVGRNLDAAVSSRLASSGYQAAPSVSEVVSGVWNESRAAYSTAGTFGSLLDVAVSSRLSSSGYQAAPAVSEIVSGVWNEPQASHAAAGSFGSLLDAAISSRSTYSGGPVASVVAPVTVGANQDKTGYDLSAKGLDQVPVETGVNARQALAPILAASAGVLSGAGTGSISIKGGNVATTRIMATTDAAGNRTSVSLVLPA
jgi:hypothetical protein